MGLSFQRTSRGNLVANLLLYMPLGLCLLLSWPARWGRPTHVSDGVSGTVLSFAVEMLQVYAPSRVSSLTDVVYDAGGTLGRLRRRRARAEEAELEVVKFSCSRHVPRMAIGTCKYVRGAIKAEYTCNEFAPRTDAK